jgi:hypothetical protein
MSVRCELRKWNGFQTYVFEADVLGRDEYGTWLGVPAPTPYTKPKGPGVWEHNFVILIPADDWWMASFYDERHPKGIELYIDVIAPAAWTEDGRVEAIDLDLDVVRRFDGQVYLKDSDEFEERRVEMGYPDDVVEHARTTAQSRLAAVEGRHEPFDTVGSRWLDKLASP